MTRLRPITLLLPLLCTLPALAVQIPWGDSQTIQSSLDNPEALALGFVDQDADLDLVVCAENAGLVRYLRGTGGSGFVATTVLDGLYSPASVAIGDYDGDGDGDILVGQFDQVPAGRQPGSVPEAEIIWIENPAVGGGDWTAHSLGDLDSGARNVIFADLDQDADLDFVLATAGPSVPGRIYWMINDSFLGPVAIADDLSSPLGLAAGDIDRDGDLDVVATDSFDSQIFWLENEGSTITAWTAHVIDDTLLYPRSLALGDFDRDGDLDAVSGGGGDATVAWFEQTASSWIRHDMSTSLGSPDSFQVVDLDQDGDEDVLAVGSTVDTVVWFENLGDGTWSRRDVSTAVDYASSVAAGDLDQDGDPDLVAAAGTGDAVVRWENRTLHRRFYAPERVAMRSELAEPRALSVADLNGDGWLDVTTALWEGDAIQACLAVDPATNLWLTDTVAAAGSFDGARAVTTADVNGDGALDLVGAAVSADDIAWWQNDGDWNPTWTRHTVLSALDGAHRAAPIDFDRDGDIDLAVAAYDGDQVRLERNEGGSGTTWTDLLLSSVNGPFHLLAGDLDRDGDPDLAVEGYDGDLIRVLLNDFLTSGSWSTVDVATGVDGPRGLDLCDLDADGDLDLVTLARNTDQIRWWANDGAGGGWTVHDVGSGYFDDGAGVRCLDVDRDGDADVAAAGQASDAVWVWFNDGAGLAWTRYQMEGTLDWAFEVDAGDLDRDGDVDLAAAAGGTSDALVWYPNVGGQYVCKGEDWAPSLIAEGVSKIVISFYVLHNGRSADRPLVLHQVRFGFATESGTPLTTSQINSLATDAWIYQDTNHDFEFTPGTDIQVAHATTISLTGGVWSVTLTTEVPAVGAWRYFLVLAADPGAGPRLPNPVVVSMDEDICLARDHDVASPYLLLDGEPGTTVATDPIRFGANLFADGFETGNTTRWSAIVGG